MAAAARVSGHPFPVLLTKGIPSPSLTNATLQAPAIIEEPQIAQMEGWTTNEHTGELLLGLFAKERRNPQKAPAPFFRWHQWEFEAGLQI